MDTSEVTAIIVAADLENASSLDLATLELGIQAIAAWHSHFADLVQLDSAVFNPVIDGALIAIPVNALKSDEIRTEMHQRVLSACQRWIVGVTSTSNQLALRIAVHYSEALIFDNNGSGRIIVGRGASHCSRLVRLAVGNQVVVSEEFVESWTNRNRRAYTRFASDNRLYPVANQQPFLFWQKANTPSRVRYIVDDAEPRKRVSSPAALRAHLAVRNAQSLMVEMQYDLAVYLDQLRAQSGKDSPPLADEQQLAFDRQLFGRVSIYRPDPSNPKMLRCWLRLERDYFDQAKEKEDGNNSNAVDPAATLISEYPRSTQYSVEPPKGPVGFAFEENEPFLVPSLPPWGKKEQKELYRSKMYEFNMTDDEVNGLHHHSRAYFAIPFGESDLNVDDSISGSPNPVHPTGVLCVDWDIPLDFLKDAPQAMIDFFTEYAVYRFSFVAACLMREGS